MFSENCEHKWTHETSDADGIGKVVVCLDCKRTLREVEETQEVSDVTTMECPVLGS